MINQHIHLYSPVTSSSLNSHKNNSFNVYNCQFLTILIKKQGNEETDMKLFCKKKEPVTYDEKYLVEEINMTKAALSAAYANFDNATDPDLIDCYIYQLNSEQKRYKYLLQKAKESEIYSYIPDI